MHDLAPLTPLGTSEPRVDTIGPRTMTEMVDTALASVAARAGKGGAAASFVAGIAGTDAPGPGRLATGNLGAFWIGPGQWMIEAPLSTHADLADRLASQSGGTVSVTEQTGAWCRFDIRGRDLARVLERLCPVDAEGFEGGEAVRTGIEHLGCFVLCRAPGHVSILGPRSAAGSLHHALTVALVAAA